MSELLSDEEASAARWRAVLSDPEFMEALLSGAAVRPEGWWKEPAECPVRRMFELFPVRPMQ